MTGRRSSTHPCIFVWSTCHLDGRAVKVQDQALLFPYSVNRLLEGTPDIWPVFVFTFTVYNSNVANNSCLILLFYSMFQTWPSLLPCRCLLSYQVLYSVKSSHGPFKQVNKVDIIFTSFHHLLSQGTLPQNVESCPYWNPEFSNIPEKRIVAWKFE